MNFPQQQRQETHKKLENILKKLLFVNEKLNLKSFHMKKMLSSYWIKCFFVCLSIVFKTKKKNKRRQFSSQNICSLILWYSSNELFMIKKIQMKEGREKEIIFFSYIFWLLLWCSLRFLQILFERMRRFLI